MCKTNWLNWKSRNLFICSLQAIIANGFVYLPGVICVHHNNERGGFHIRWKHHFQIACVLKCLSVFTFIGNVQCRIFGSLPYGCIKTETDSYIHLERALNNRQTYLKETFPKEPKTISQYEFYGRQIRDMILSVKFANVV